MFSYLITVVPPQVCLIDGVTYTAGLEFVAADGCNECECIAGVITCTTEPCAGKCTRLLIAELECSWCEMFLVRDVLGARCSWCAMFLVRDVPGARSSWCEKFLMREVLGARSSWLTCGCYWFSCLDGKWRHGDCLSLS